MDYFGVIKKAFKITWQNKFLWVFGILAGSTAGMKGLNFQIPSNFNWQDTWNKYSSQDLSNIDWTTFWSNHGTALLILMAILAFLAILCFVLSLMSQGALIGAVAKVEKDQTPTFVQSFLLGWHSFWRIWGVNITLLLMILIALSVWILPTCALVIYGAYTSAWIVGILLFLLNLAFWVLITLISPYALRIVVLKKHSIFESIREALHFVRDHLLSVLVTYLLLMAVGLAVGLAVILVSLFLIAILSLIGLGLFEINSIAVVFYAIIVVLSLIVVGLIFSGAYSTFTSTILTLTYLKLIGKD